MNMTNLLIALSLLNTIFSTLRGVKTLLEELQGLIEVIMLLEIKGNDLIHSYKLLANFFFYFSKVSIDSLCQSGFKISHGIKNVKNLFLANTQSHISLGDTLNMSWGGLERDVEALFVEVGGSFIVVKILKLLSYTSVLFEAVFGLAFSIVLFRTNEVITQLE